MNKFVFALFAMVVITATVAAPDGAVPGLDLNNLNPLGSDELGMCAL